MLISCQQVYWEFDDPGWDEWSDNDMECRSDNEIEATTRCSRKGTIQLANVS